jgi:hypothetical protein
MAVSDDASRKCEQFANSQHVEEAQAAAKLLQKCDLHLIPPLMVVYFLSFMDRTNIGT